MPFVNPRIVAIVLSLVLAGPLFAPLATSADRCCGRCIKPDACCCAARQGPGGCALARPCATGSGTDGVIAPAGVDKGLPVVSNAVVLPQTPPQALHADRFVDPCGSSPVPPDPPPRASL